MRLIARLRILAVTNTVVYTSVVPVVDPVFVELVMVAFAMDIVLAEAHFLEEKIVMVADGGIGQCIERLIILKLKNSLNIKII